MPIFPTIKLNIERWKYNPTFELYVSNMGHIKNKSKADIAPKILQGGYVVVYVYGSLNKYMLLHRVVMLTWRPTPEAEELTVDHLDHNKRNNALSNLEWVTREENMKNELTLKNLEKANLEKSKTVYVYSEGLELLSAFTSTADAARQLNKSQGNITSCASGALRRYLGYIFSYVELTDKKQREEIEESRSEQRAKNYQSTLEATKRYFRRHPQEYKEYQKECYRKNCFFQNITFNFGADADAL